MNHARTPLRGVFAATALLLAGCAELLPVDPVPRPPERPARAAPAPEVEAPERPAESAALVSYYTRVQQNLLTQGLLRQDGGGPDTPFDADRLAQTFRRVALFQEYDTSGGGLVQRETASQLHRWETPVRIEPRFGASVTPDRVTRDRNAMIGLASRLSRAARHPVDVVEEGGNFIVYVVREDERKELGPELRRLLPGLGSGALSTVLDLPRQNYCVVFASDPRDNGAYTRAVAIVRAEHPDLLRLSCLHEEITQGLGLANDWPGARPSIFNDDEEFALLTTMDEALLRILYDARLRPGMTEAEVAPLLPGLAREAIGGGGS
ncbi:Protein of unknown function [Palleronia salina]|uniref:DUF2927 domain-containing protein n=1 Tax=Palleronia salina TaxID=313368 RepID=A0A1M6K353_9RHOB|nr:DUF2927 domain-containing protein [Palleronia salina]SHJ53337.1 Protein of unknown function [Palleronia salina]